MILRYGKTWTEETALPEAKSRTPSSPAIAFAGSEALVAYSVQPNLAETRSSAACSSTTAAAGASTRKSSRRAAGPPVSAVAGLPDGGAAVLAGEGADYACTSARIGGSPWQRGPVPVPSGLAGSLALFRQGGALRALVVAGGGAGVAQKRCGSNPRPGFPP